ncbi:hypothetical protein [Isoptericola cucumis]|uniref:Uncharacterized protein n=1 Tax=Isoptericola cucumis TaxID=1776856 RepID=A0ABQ2B4Z8_9MICO|nr:hypothetical protein [Isoptericola cucumis]GGI06096.1 hypothetical protein GCM10007368_09440 [Isoptericola cucumis]
MSDEGIDFDGLADGMREFAAAWDAVAYHCGDPTPPSSRCALEATVLPSSVEAPEQLTRSIAQDSAVYVTAAAQHVRALARLLGPEVVLTGWTVTRSVDEYCGRVAWLLATDVEPINRVARFYMERIVGLHMARVSENNIGHRARAKEFRKAREATIAQARTMFPDIVLYGEDGPNEWIVGGEQYSSLRKAVNDFGRERLHRPGLYDMLSSFTHPALARLKEQTRVTQLENRLHQAFIAEPEVIRWQMAVACGSVYSAAQHVISYLGLDDSPLEQWADQHPELMGWSLSSRDVES